MQILCMIILIYKRKYMTIIIFSFYSFNCKFFKITFIPHKKLTENIDAFSCTKKLFFIELCIIIILCFIFEIETDKVPLLIEIFSAQKTKLSSFVEHVKIVRGKNFCTLDENTRLRRSPYVERLESAVEGDQ